MLTKTKLMTIDVYMERHRGNATLAALAAEVNYWTFLRWLKRESFAPNNSASRRLMAEKGIDLPRPTEGESL